MRKQILILTLSILISNHVPLNTVAAANFSAANLSKPYLKRAKLHKLSIAKMTTNLEFDFCKALVRSNNYEQLDALAQYLNGHSYAVLLRGHADAIGSYVGNWKMSEKRADAIKDYLVSKGVSADKVITTPFGSTLPIATNKTAAGRQKNRRVEVKLKEITT
jgi:outer membrane protein OmpA-like peptidoglycan-associated protein